MCVVAKTRNSTSSDWNTGVLYFHIVRNVKFNDFSIVSLSWWQGNQLRFCWSWVGSIPDTISLLRVGKKEKKEESTSCFFFLSLSQKAESRNIYNNYLWTSAYVTLCLYWTVYVTSPCQKGKLLKCQVLVYKVEDPNETENDKQLYLPQLLYLLFALQRDCVIILVS